MDLIEGGEIKALSKRGITEETCAKFGYRVGVDSKGTPVQIAPYYTVDGELIAQKIRYQNKDFTCTGVMKKATLFGQQLWRDKGKMVVITEGEIDCLTISQLQGNKWPVVSLRNGASGAAKCIQNSIEWLHGFDSVVLAFDMDDAGKKAIEDCIPILPPGRVKVWNIPMKDANEMLLAGREKELIDAIWGAKVYRPDGIVSVNDTWDMVATEEKGANASYPFECLNKMYDGLRLREIVTFCAGSGIGKSAICREIAAHLVTQGETVGYIALEESVKRSVLGLLSIFMNAPLHKPAVLTAVKTSHAEELAVAWGRLQNRVYFYDHWGSTESDNLMNKIRYLAHGCGCKWIILDHLSIVISGQADGEERRLIDNTMTALRGLVEELGIGMILVSHLKRPEGKGHEEGAVTSLAHLRGSASIAQLSDAVVGSERNQQDPLYAHVTTLRGLKNRYSGETGIAGYLSYDVKTGRLKEHLECPFESVPEESSNGTSTSD
ncbi:MAG: DnaB-like helicase C-terminal domain-containing protein [Cetobacterium sp.]